jgi:hypothetical protein
MNSKMVKSEMVVLTERERSDMVDADVDVGWMLQPAARAVVDEREKKTDVAWTRMRYRQTTTGTSLKGLLLTCNYVTSSTNQHISHQHPSKASSSGSHYRLPQRQ